MGEELFRTLATSRIVCRSTTSRASRAFARRHTRSAVRVAYPKTCCAAWPCQSHTNPLRQIHLAMCFLVLNVPRIIVAADEREPLFHDDVGHVDDETQAVRCARLLAEQARRLRTTNEGWREVEAPGDAGGDLKVESKPIQGSTEKHNSTCVKIARAEGRIDCSAEELYDLLVSKEGFRLLDPASDPADFGKALVGPFSFAGEGEETGTTAGRRSRVVRVEKAVAALKFYLAKRVFIVANVFNGPELTMSSTSVLCSKCPGGSALQAEEKVVNSWKAVRVAFTGHYLCQPIDDGACLFRAWQFIDLGGILGGDVSNKATLSWFAPCYERIRAHVRDTKKGRSDSC